MDPETTINYYISVACLDKQLTDNQDMPHENINTESIHLILANTQSFKDN